ncbi:ribonuclease III [Arenibacter latericius]|uniref:ribonuclease III n=1 Tax=Arenibacter latericius TaxID=86104 RepID=UPI00040C4A00|nr:ribonuclease III [Arenibacter latericius]
MNFPTNLFYSHSKQDGDFFLGMRKILGFKPKKIEIFKKAFVHRSVNKKDKDGNPINYERLEFLGDAMLGTIISKHLYLKVPDGDEGYLTKMRSKIVSREHLNELGKDLRLIDFVESKIPKSRFGDNIHGNVFEALVGAIYLDRGYKYCEKFISEMVIAPYVDIEQLEGKVISYKSLVIEWCQKQKKSFNFDVYEDTGNDAVKHFAVKLTIDDKVVAKARATSKKKAEERAAKRAYFALQDKIKKS